MKRLAVFALTLIGATTAAAQSIKPRPLGAVQATSKELLGSATLARVLPTGGVIVNDAARRRLILLDPSLQSFTVIADSTSGSVNGYGQRPGALIPYVADSTLFLDATAGSFLVIDPAGKVARVMSPPRPSDNNVMANTIAGFPGFDANGRMVYRTNFPRNLQQLRDGTVQPSAIPDSAPVIRVDLDTRRADTVGAVRIPRTIMTTITMPNGGTMSMGRQAPLATIDDWAILSDGSIAIIRGGDYRIDWILPDGSRRSSEKVAFDWKRLTDDDKLAIVDSITKAMASGPAGGPGGAPQMMMGGGDRVTFGGGGGGSVTVTREIGAGPVPAGGRGAGGAPGAGMAMPTLPPPSASDLPDYMPPFTAASARPDADANLWIRTTTPGMAPGNLVYDVINSKGVLVDRVDVPKGMSIVGFGKGGTVFLIEREGYGYRFLRASVR